jgi:hypothetical protein
MEQYNQRISQLIILQRWFRKTLLIKDLVLRSKQIIPLYYAPNAIGGIREKNRLMDMLDSM